MPESTEQALVNADTVPGSSENDIPNTSGEKEQPLVTQQDPEVHPSPESGVHSLTTAQVEMETPAVYDGQAPDDVDQVREVAGSASMAADGQAVTEAVGETEQVSGNSSSKPPRHLEPLQRPSSPHAPQPLSAVQDTESQVQ